MTDDCDFSPVLEAVKGKSYILDVDLDFFSTKNPFKDLYLEADFYQRLKKIYVFDASFNSVKDSSEKISRAQESCRQRKLLLAKLQDLTDYLNEGKDISEYTGIGDEYKALMSSLKRDIDEKCSPKNEVNWQEVHDAGCTCDDSELPHHVSTIPEIENLMSKFKELLDSFNHNPGTITIARSSLDNYCPPEQVEFIQTKTLELLQSKYDLKVIYPYLKYTT